MVGGRSFWAVRRAVVSMILSVKANSLDLEDMALVYVCVIGSGHVWKKLPPRVCVCVCVLCVCVCVCEVVCV